MAKKILVTGAAGFVGRHIVKHLLDEGHEVHAVDPIVPLTGGLDPAKWLLFTPWDYDNFYFYKEDCRDWFDAVHDTDFDYAYHLAAMVGGREMIENNPLAVADDLSIDASYWQWAKIAKPKKTVCFSSSAAYPIELQREQSHRLLRESDIGWFDTFGMPDMSYGWAKLTCEYLARLAYEKHGFRSIVYRPFSGYGEDQDDAYPFPSICKRVLRNVDFKKPTLNVWGSGRQMRDFIHIDDCVRAIAATVDQIDDGGAVNLATGVLTSFIEFAKIAANALGYDPEIIGMSLQPEGVFARGGDPSKLASLGFSPSIAFPDGIKAALAYFERFPNAH